MPAVPHPSALPVAAPSLRRPELLAPAGDWECVRAAVENGADAIYFGLERFNARMRAKNFTQADLPALMEFLHRRGVRGYVTFNTLVFTNEIVAAADYLRTIIAAGVDAAIVQDIGACRIIRELSPDFPIHGSTQMTITSAAGVDFAAKLGAQLVVLARENSIADIEKIQATPDGRKLPLEVFVHGALCVAYSGQCLTSESLGGRSANRGECAQACRLPYDLIADGKQVDLGDRRYLLSPQDLAGIDVLSDLVRVGVTSLKIEGRLKSPEYVASITRVYRAAIDRAMAELSPVAVSGEARYELEMAFSRGLETGWFRGTNNQELVHARFGTKRGVFLGEVERVANEAVALKLAAPLKPGDGVVFDAGKPAEREEGGRVYQIETHGGEATLRFGQGDIDWRRVRPGQLLWKTNDPALDRELRSTFEGEQVRFQRPITLEVHGHAGAPLTLIASDGGGHVVQAQSAVPLAAAEKQPLSIERLRDQLGRLGGTPFKLGALSSKLEGDVILPVSALNQLRREVVAELERLRASPKRWTLNAIDIGLMPEGGPGKSARRASSDSPPAAERSAAAAQPELSARRAVDPPAAEVSPRSGQTLAQPELVAVIRLLEQLEPAWHAGARTIYCEFENPKHYRDAVSCFRQLQSAEAGGSVAAPNLPLVNPARSEAASLARISAPGAAIPSPSSTIWVVPPRIHKPGEEWILKQVRSSEADGYLVRNYDHLAFFADDRKRGDFSLNVANPWTAQHFRSRYGLERVTASYDLNITQLDALLTAAPGEWFDVTIHQHMPMFHMEHCVFCAFLSQGKDYRDCGRPCEKHRVALRDRVGAELPLRADAGCRNTVFNNRAQTGAEYVGRLLELGVRSFRVEFVNEPANEVARTLDRYQRLLRGEISGAELWRELKLLHQLGVTRGQMETAAPVLAKKR
jgi:U32 family peptidase